MKTTLQIVAILMVALLPMGVMGQIFEPEGLNMPGTWDGFTNPPNVAALRSNTLSSGEIIKITTGTVRWQTLIHVAASGGDITGGSYTWLFTSGPVGNRFSNKWAGVNVSMNTIQSYTHNDGTDNTITVANDNYYVVNWRDNGYTGTSAIFMELSAEPIDITDIDFDSSDEENFVVTITLSGSKSTEEKVYIRYTTDGFATSKHVLATGSGTSYTAEIPLSSSIEFYGLTTTVDLGADNTTFGGDYDMVSIKIKNDSGPNYFLYNASTSISNSAGWRMLSSPVSTTYANLLGPVWTQGFSDGADVTNGTANVMTHSSSGFAPPTHLNISPAAGQGFIYYHFNDDNYDGNANTEATTLSVTGAENAAVSDFALTAGSVAVDEGWTLMGNPFATTIDWEGMTKSGSVNGSVYVYTNVSPDVQAQGQGFNSYIAWNGSSGSLTDGLIAPFQGFFVKADAAAQTISIPTSAKSGTAGTFRQKEMTPSDFRIRLSDGNRHNDAWFSFTQSGEIGRDGADAYKLDPLDGTFISLFSTIDGIPMDIQNLPATFENRLEIPLSLKSMKDNAGIDGDFSLSMANLNGINETWDIVLVDHETNTMVDLRSDTHSFRWTTPREKMRPATERMGDPIMKTAAASSPRFTLIVDPSKTTSTKDDGRGTMDVFALDQNYPNPFNPSTQIRFTLQSSDVTRLTVYDILGREIAVLVDGVMPAGAHTATFDASNLTSGVYIYKLEAGGQVMTKRMTLVK